MVYPGHGRKGYPVIRPFFLGGIQFDNRTGLIPKTIIFIAHLNIIFLIKYLIFL